MINLNELESFFMAEKPKAPVQEYFTSGCTLMDLLLGGEKGVLGFPFGRILDITGDKSSGKSFLKNEFIANSYYKYGERFKWFADDTETGDTFDSSKLYGFNIHPDGRKLANRSVTDSNTIEELDAHVTLMCDGMSDGEVGIYAVDSIDGISDKHREEKSEHRAGQLKQNVEVKDAGDYGAQLAKFLSQEFFPTQHIPLKNKNCALILINQIRENFGTTGYGPNWKITGGKALDFYFHTQLFLKTVCKLGKNGQPISQSDGIPVGAYVKATSTKAKTARPYRTIWYTVWFNYGIDNIRTSIDYLFDLRDSSGKLKVGPINWDGKPEPSLKNLTQCLEENGWKDACRDAKKAAGQGSVLSVDYITSWIKENHPDKWKEFFGEPYSYDDLVSAIENSPEMEAELTRRVIDKWEAKEDAANPVAGRKPRFPMK